ncbi:MAG: STAS domain-containing protein [Rhodanobacter sp.]|jgi:anti-anti-sigma factor|uniref:STAS domain-containing protein n=2 Tax=unclassified Rhodanobacter TaxID=2621553 RepID=A0AB74URW4_9GAMM|nr:STAS domain-containing protein [Rhodanobacter sp.]MBN8946607.1 STAS domain-containing protein [Rhodanobacter sp.]ODT93688.1 MAG: anti-anti-sigma factor [Rhodanobacter sp. SCN 67-45]OJW41301.1 MAG: anti-anti-sigma factor [Rhodanobacter sp. 67-28]
MIVHHDSESDCLSLQLGERFDFSIHREFHDACLGAGRVARSYLIDLAEVTHMDSSALGMLLLLREHAGADHADIRIVNAGTELRGTLRVAGFDKLFVLH